MQANQRLRIAIQKSGRLNSDSLALLSKCGLQIQSLSHSLFYQVENLPIDLLFVRDDDIPTLVFDDICDLGIVGENVLLEQTNKNAFVTIKKLGFSRCRLSIAVPSTMTFENPKCLQNLRIATSYPNLLRDYLYRKRVYATIKTISGSVEIAPRFDIADAICDLVSTGKTLKENNLKEVDQVIQSQAVLIKTMHDLNIDKHETYKQLLRRINTIIN
jgi:ATP phosphoribosyltransferase